jgi:hypothetical protein
MRDVVGKEQHGRREGRRGGKKWSNGDMRTRLGAVELVAIGVEAAAPVLLADA